MFETVVADTKSARTRALILNTALSSFRTRGYDETTIRLIAAEAGVSVGNAYYYFPTKNHLVQELYLRVQTDHRDLALPSLDGTDDLIERLRIAYRSGLDTLAPFHGYAPGFLSAAVSPRSPISPLGADSGPARDIAVGIFRDALSGAKRALPAEFDDALPGALLLAYLLLTLYWVYDDSPDQQRTHRLLDRGLKLLALVLPLSRMPLLRKPMRQFLDLISEVGA